MKKTNFEVFITFLKIGAMSFGASASQAMEEELVEKKRLFSKEHFTESFALAGLSPGPFHINFVTLLGYQLNNYLGIVFALMGFLLPSFILAIIAITFLNTPLTKTFLQLHPGILQGITASIAGLLTVVIARLGQKVFTNYIQFTTLAIITLTTLTFQLSPFIVIVASGTLAICYGIVLKIFKRTKQ